MGDNMSDFKPLNTYSQGHALSVLFFDGDAENEPLIDNVLSRIKSVMLMHEAIANLPPDVSLDGVPFSEISTLILSDAYSLLLALNDREAKNKQRHEVTVTVPDKHEESSRV